MKNTESFLNAIVGYGFNQRGACNRDGSLESYDYSFRTLEEAEEKYDAIVSAGYGNKMYHITPVTYWDVIVADAIQDSEFTGESFETCLDDILEELNLL